MGQRGVVGTAGEIAAADHRHPGGFRPRWQQLANHRIPGAADAAHPLIHEEVFEQQPAELVGEFKRLNQSLFFQFTQGPLVCQ